MRHPTGGNPDTDWKPVRLLVFGLDDQFRFLARQTFRKLNVKDVTPFSDPGETTGLMARGVDLVLVDLGAGPESGLAVIEALRRPAGTPHDRVPVLVVAPPPQADAVSRAKDIGIEGVIPKPVSGHELAHRVAETLAAPCRMPKPSQAQARPRVSYIKDPDPLPDLPPVETPSPTAATVIPEIAALTARLEAKGIVPSAARPGPALASMTGSPPASAPSSSAPAGRLAHGDLTPARRPGGGKLDLDDMAPARRPSGGKLDAADLAPLKPDPEAEAARKRAEKRRLQWKEALEKTGRKPRKGGDVAGLDLSAVVAEHLQWLQTKGAEGKRATFQGMDLAGADLSGAILANATFREVDLSDACLADARLDGSDFRYATLSAADLAGANLGVAALRHAKLDLSNLEGAILRGSDLSGARLSGARMAGADLKGAILIGSDLREADLSKVDGLTQAQIEKSLCDMTTRLPPGVFRPRKAGE
ncbi:pentapeptide repeat-containing protein [Magnetospirillum sp. SS-4]|uniref:pentapeptide repeat-containing protein n=1 Tax=Magnetospirillum sp. SS-4 TaxID=2681465 RepID=UPI00137E993F|nr:pentapeptide repeat-containing protein [Magnetospirillum sp. SS-4]CAA7615894.1 conserved hypothetical protein [Magnetospirillum sp. SS-4]